MGNIFDTAVHECLCEMYAKAQPEADYDNILEEIRSGKIAEADHVFCRHYLSKEEYSEIIKKYLQKYHLQSQWHSHVDLLRKYLVDGGKKEVYVKPYVDKHDIYHPGCYDEALVKPVKEQVAEYLATTEEKDPIKLAQGIEDIMLESIAACEKRYKHDNLEDSFRLLLRLKYKAPIADKDTVKNWWKKHYGVDIEIEDRDELLANYYNNTNVNDTNC